MSRIDESLDISVSGKRIDELEKRVGELERLLNRWATPVHTFVQIFNEKTLLHEVYDEMGTLCGTFRVKGFQYSGAVICEDWQLDKDCLYTQREIVQLTNHLKSVGVI